MNKNISLKNYYTNYFPYDQLYKIFNISINREICFRLDNTIYKRYLLFESSDHFKNQLIEQLPTQIDLGPIYEYPASKNNIKDDPLAFKNIRKELVFDIDVTDYPDRKCECNNQKKICNECFNLVKAAMEHLDHVLRYNFGFKKLLYIFSGGKGMHCWVLDDNSVDITQESKKSIVNFIKIHKDKKVYEIYKTKYGLDITKDIIKIDSEVTIKSQHLLKMPFSVHSNNTISVAVDIKTLKDLKLESFPKLDDIENNLEVLEKHISILDKLL